VFTGEKAYYEDNQVFLDAGATDNGSTLDANLPWGANGNAAAKTVTAQVELAEGTAGAFTKVTAGVGTGTGQILLVEASSKSGDCFYIVDDETTASAPIIAYAESSSTCVSATPAIPTAIANVLTTNAGSAIATAAPTNAQWHTSW
jgi:hypothetical protein